MEWAEKRVGGKGMEEKCVNSTMGQHSPAHTTEKLKITVRVAGTSLKGSFWPYLDSSKISNLSRRWTLYILQMREKCNYEKNC